MWRSIPIFWLVGRGFEGDVFLLLIVSSFFLFDHVDFPYLWWLFFLDLAEFDAGNEGTDNQKRSDNTEQDHEIDHVFIVGLLVFCNFPFEIRPLFNPRFNCALLFVVQKLLGISLSHYPFIGLRNTDERIFNFLAQLSSHFLEPKFRVFSLSKDQAQLRACLYPELTLPIYSIVILLCFFQLFLNFHHI